MGSVFLAHSLESIEEGVVLVDKGNVWGEQVMITETFNASKQRPVAVSIRTPDASRIGSSK